MKKVKGFRLAMTLLLALVLLLSGCGKSTVENGDKNVKGNATATKSTTDEITFPLKEQVVLKVITPLKDGASKNDGKKMFEQIEDQLNVEIDWEHYYTSGWQEMKSLIFASNEMPDIFAGQHSFSMDEIVSYGEQGFFVPLEGMFDKYAPNLLKIFEKRPDFIRSLTLPDGHIYSLFSFLEDKNTTPDTLLINGNWLEKLNLEMPKTTDDFYNILKAFKTGDPNGNNEQDEIPFTFRHNVTGQGLYSMFGAFGIVDSGNHMVLKDDTIIYAPIQPEYREGIKYFNKLFKDGLADIEALTHKVSVYNAKTTIKEKEKMIAGAFIRWQNLGSFGGEDVGMKYVPPLEGPKGHRLWRVIEPDLDTKGSFAITTVNKHPEVSVKWIDMFYDEEISFQMKHGMIGETIKVDENGKFVFLETPEGESTLDWRQKDVDGMFVYNVWREWTDRFELDPIVADKKYADDLYRPFRGGFDTLPTFIMTPEIAEEISILTTDIKNYVDDTVAKFLLEGGAEDDGKWNAYVKKCEDMGVKRLVELNQQLYDKTGSK